MNTLVALIPILLLFVLMLGFKAPGHKSALITLIVTLLIAFFLPERMGFAPQGYESGMVGYAVVEGILKAIFPILIVILMAIFSYNVLLESGEIEVIKKQFSSLTGDRGVMVLLLTWGFGGILEGMAGFGTAVAIPAAILISLGFKPVFSALVSLLANSVPTGFGAVGIPVITLANEASPMGQASQETISDISGNVVLQLSPLLFILPFIILTLTDGSLKNWLKNLFFALWVGAVSFGSQYLAAHHLGAETPAILGSVAAVVAILLWARLFEKKTEGRERAKFTLSETFKAWSVYLFILLFILLSSPLAPAVNAFLKGHLVSKVALPIYAEGHYFTFAWLANAGLMLFLGTVIGGLIQGLSFARLLRSLTRTTINLSKTIITIICLVTLASVMNYAGMINEIGSGLVAVTGRYYPLFAPLIGALGTFVTGSDTSSNILFGKLQANVAGQLAYPDTNWLVAANTAGATGGKIISPQSIAIATASCNMQGQDGDLMRKAIPYAFGYIVVAGLMVYFGGLVF